MSRVFVLERMSPTRLAVIFALAAAAIPAATIPSPRVAIRDPSGFLYLGGTTYTPDLPTTPGVLQPIAPATPFKPAPFLAKVAPDGAIVWATYFAGNDTDQIAVIALAPNGDLIVAGNTTSTNLLPDRQGYQPQPASLFVARLTPDGANISRATYFGGKDADLIQSLLIDASGNIFIAGIARSASFPTTPGAYRTSGAPASFIAKFDGALQRLLLSTLVAYTILDNTPSGTSVIIGKAAMALGPDSSLYLAATGPPSLGSPGPMAMSVTHLTADAARVLYSSSFTTYFVVAGIVVDAWGNAYVASYQPRYEITQPGSNILELSPAGELLWNSTVDGANINSLILGGQELVFTGLALDLLFPPTLGAPQACFNSGAATPITTYVARFDTVSRSFTYAGYLNAADAWLTADPDLIIAESPYVGLPRFTTVPASIPQPGTVTCVANAASSDNTSTAPGEILSIYGTGIGPVRPTLPQFDQNGNVNKTLGGITITFDGIPAPILYAAPGQINLVTPFSLQPGTTHIELRNSGTLLLAIDRTVTAIHPGFFTANGLRSGPLAALNQDGSVNSAANPAAPSSIVSIFATGLGAMTPTPVDGSIPQAPGFHPIAPFTFHLFIVLAGGFVPGIDYIGNAPGLVQGAIQINFQLPPITPIDGKVQVQSGNNGTIWVR
jgi:uncharacterized protein (TIGR03437 family)